MANEETEVEGMDKAPPASPELRAIILKDPNSERMAKALGLTLDEFVNRVGYFMANPDAQPLFAVVPDEKLAEMGVQVPTEEAVEANVKASVAAIQAGEQRSGFDSAKKNAVEISTGGGKALTSASSPDLEEAVKKLRRPNKG
jgi:hypothetical protein